MTEVSAHLRAARERAGLTIQEISASTRIGVSALQAIERGDFDRLPGDFYTRAFLRTYARELHLSPDAIVHEYEAERAPAPTAAQAPPIGDDQPRHQPRAWSPPLSTSWRRVMAIAGNAGVVIAMVVALLVVAVIRSRPGVPRAPEPGAVGTAGASAAVPAAAPQAAAPETRPDKLVLEIQAAAPIWVTGAADGTRVLYRLLAPGERVTVTARDDLSFRIGNAAAFTYTINGKPGRPLGGSGEVREFQITRDNYRTFSR